MATHRVGRDCANNEQKVQGNKFQSLIGNILINLSPGKCVAQTLDCCHSRLLHAPGRKKKSEEVGEFFWKMGFFQCYSSSMPFITNYRIYNIHQGGALKPKVEISKLKQQNLVSLCISLPQKMIPSLKNEFQAPASAFENWSQRLALLAKVAVFGFSNAEIHF